MVAIMQSHSCVPCLLISHMNHLFALFHSISQQSTHLFHLSRHHETSTTFFPRPGIDVCRHRPSSLLCSIYWPRRSTQPSRLESWFLVTARSTRKPSHNDNVIASAWFEDCLLGWFRHELTPRSTPLLSAELGRVRPSNGHIDVVQGAAATRLRRRQIFILLQPRPSDWSADEFRWGIIKTEEMLKMYVCSEWNSHWSQIQTKWILIPYSNRPLFVWEINTGSKNLPGCYFTANQFCCDCKDNVRLVYTSMYPNPCNGLHKKRRRGKKI